MLTVKQQQTLQFIKEFFTHNEHAPTMAEIAEGIGIKSRGVVHRYVKALAEAGKVELSPGKRRNIILLAPNEAANSAGIPLIGKIAAGQPIEAIEQQEQLELGNLFVGNQYFALKVQGNSMIEEGIFDGDLVICQRKQYADNGEIVVALIDQMEATLKRIHHNPDETITLIPANAMLTPLVYEAERIMVQGIFVGLLRLAE